MNQILHGKPNFFSDVAAVDRWYFVVSVAENSFTTIVFELTGITKHFERGGFIFGRVPIFVQIS